MICAKSFKSSNIVELYALYDVFQVDEHIRTPLCMKPWFYSMVLGRDVDLETSSVISEFNSAIALLRHKNAIALFSSETSENVSKSASHPRTMRCVQANIRVGCLYASDGFCSALFGWDHVYNCHTKVYSSSYNAPHFTTTRTQAISDPVITSKGLRSIYLFACISHAVTKPNYVDKLIYLMRVSSFEGALATKPLSAVGRNTNNDTMNTIIDHKFTVRRPFSHDF